MEKNINNLIHELPDYISGNIADNELNQKIRNEIDSNPDFRAEYESMKNTFSFLGKTAISEPSPFYFNNLLPNISARIDTLETGKESIFSGWLANVLKFAIPAVIIVLGYFLYSEITGNDTEKEQMTKDKLEKNNNEMIRGETPSDNNNDITNADDSTENNNTIPEVQQTNTTNRDVVSNPNTFKTADDGGTDVITFTSTEDDELDEVISEYATYPVVGEESEIEQVQDDLTLQQQNELLNYMENAQL